MGREIGRIMAPTRHFSQQSFIEAHDILDRDLGAAPSCSCKEVVIGSWCPADVNHWSHGC